MRLTTNQLTALFAVLIAFGIGAYVRFARRADVGPGAIPAAMASPSAEGGAVSAAARNAFPPAPALARPRSAVRAERSAADVATDSAVDALTHDELRRLVERRLEGKLADRELSPRDYDRIVGAVMRLRAAVGELRHLEPARDGEGAEGLRRIVVAALAEIERITGVPPAELGDLLTDDTGKE